MAKFTFTAVPLLSIENTPGGFIGRSLEICSGETIRRTFEAKDLAEVHQRLDEICAEIGKDASKSWNVWVDTARGERAPRGFRDAKDRRQFDRAINPERVTKGLQAA
jgi:hypothetical protein